MASTATVTPALRLAPSPRLTGLLPRLIALMMRLFFGQVMSVVRIMYVRVPHMVLGQALLERCAQKLSLEPHLRHLIELRICAQNSCTFCADLALAGTVLLRGPEVPDEEVRAAVDDPRFDGPTRAALRYADELGRDRTVSDATFADLLKHFSDKEVAEIVWLCAFTNYHNLMAKPLGLSSEGFCDLARARRGQGRAPTTAPTRPTS